MRFCERESSDAIFGRPMTMNPLHRLPKKFTPVRAAMMIIMRVSFKVPSSRSMGTCDALSETDLLSSVACGGERTVPPREIEFRGGERENSFLLVGTNSMAVKSSDMVMLQYCEAQGNRAEI
jgi:hypothetical protein